MDDASLCTSSLCSTAIATEETATNIENDSGNGTLLDYHGYPEYGNDNLTTALPDLSMLWQHKFAWISVYSIMILVASFGNALVTWTVLDHRKMKTVTNYFLVNLSIADLTMMLFNCIFNFIYMLNKDWLFGKVYCTINNFVANLTVAASVFTLVAISIDRFIAVVYPLKPRMRKLVARIAILIIWTASVVLAIPCLIYSKTISFRLPNEENRTACLIVWPDGYPNVSYQDFIYNMIFTILTYFVPVLVMAISYARMGCTLWKSTVVGESNQQQLKMMKSRRKVVLMFIVVVVLFVICWLPYHTYFFYQYIDSRVVTYQYSQDIFLAFYWLAMSGAMINPIVYYLMNAKFKRYFKKAIGRIFMCNRINEDIKIFRPTVNHLSHSNDSAYNSKYGIRRRSPVTRKNFKNITHQTATELQNKTPLMASSGLKILRHRNIRFTNRQLALFQRIANKNRNFPGGPTIIIPDIYFTAAHPRSEEEPSVDDVGSTRVIVHTESMRMKVPSRESESPSRSSKSKSGSSVSQETSM